MTNKILAFNTSDNFISVALSENGKVIACNEEFSMNKQAEKIVLLIEKTLLDGKIWYNDLDNLVVINGPGSFTSVRIGISLAKGIIKASKVNAIAVSNFEILFYRAMEHMPNYEKFIILIDARRDQIYFQEFSLAKINNNPLQQFTICRDFTYEESNLGLATTDKISRMLKSRKENLICIGSGVKLIYENIRLSNNIICLPRLNLVRAPYICQYAQYIFNKSRSEKIEPLYIRMHDAK